MYGTLVVNAWAGIHEGCDVTYNVEGSDDVYVTVSGQKQQPFEFYFQAAALRTFLERGGAALAEMNAIAAREEAGDD